MSKTYHLICPDTKEELWIGQGHIPGDFYIYTDEEDIKKIEEFLSKHKGKPLYFVDCDIMADLLAMPAEQLKEAIVEENYPT